MNKEIIFSGADKGRWIKVIVDSRDISRNINELDSVLVKINDILNIDDLEPVHIVLLACLRQELMNKGYKKCILSSDNPSVTDFLINGINLSKYWLGEKPKFYSESQSETIFNLWHVSSSEMEAYAESISDYFNRRFFKYKDLSAVKLSMLEIFYNIFDHSESKDNAFSYMKYDKATQRLYVAICDFGKGVARSIRDYFTDIECDSDALLEAIKDKVTVRSRDHNGGHGLDVVVNHLGSDDTLRILSNNALLVCSGSVYKPFSVDYNFSGTLIYYEISLINFEDMEIIDTFGLDF